MILMMRRTKCLVLSALLAVCLLVLLLVNLRSHDAPVVNLQVESLAVELKGRVRGLPAPDAASVSAFPHRLEMSDLSKNFNNFSYFYKLSEKHMDTAMHWIDVQSRLPLMRLSADEERAEYRSSRAAKWLATQSLAVMATARNALPGLRTSINNLQRLCSRFRHCSIVFLENDSHDETREVLYRLAQSDRRVTLIGCGTINSREPCRLNVSYSSGKWHQPGSSMFRNYEEEIERGLVMSALRNQLLAYVYTHMGTNHSLLLNIDPDLYWDAWDDNTLLQGLYYFASRPQLDSLCSSAFFYYWGRQTIYDPCTLDFFDKDTLGFGTQRPANDNERSEAALYTTHWPIKVSSCFQGLTFYRMTSLYTKQVLYKKGHGEWICEHNTLSRQLRENYIDVNMRLRVRVGRFLQ